MIQDDDKIVLDRWSQHYNEIKKGTVSDVIRLIKNRKIRYNSTISTVYFYFFTKDSKIWGNSAKSSQSSTLSYIQINIPVRYKEKLEFMSENNIDINIINELVDECMQKLLKQLELTKEYTFFDFVAPQYNHT